MSAGYRRAGWPAMLAAAVAIVPGATSGRGFVGCAGHRGALPFFAAHTVEEKQHVAKRRATLFYRSAVFTAAPRVFRVGDLAMSSSRTKRGLTIAALTFLAAISSGCVCPRTPRAGCACERICVESPIVSSTVVTRHADQCPIGGWLVRRQGVDGPAAGVGSDGARSVEMAAAADQAKAKDSPDAGAAPRGLTINVVDLTDPVPTGDKLTYKIIVSNDGALSERNVSVVATVPRGMIPVRIDTGGPGGRTITGQIVRFDPVAEVRPGQQREYRVFVRTLEAGRATFRAEVTSENLLQPLGAEATTEVLQQAP